MSHEARFEAQVAAFCFAALGTSILSAWVVAAFAPGHSSLAAGLGLVLPVMVIAVARLRRRVLARVSHHRIRPVRHARHHV